MSESSPPSVSLIMAAWNPNLEWFREAVDAALAQRNVPVELIVVDDGSDAPLEPLLATWADPRIRVLRVPHGGIARARTAGFREARGDYLRYIDADDSIDLDSTARLLELIAGADDIISYGVTVRCDTEMNPIGELRSDVSGNVAELCLLGKIPARHMSMLFPRAVVERVGDWDASFSACGDWDFVLRALEHAQLRPGNFVATYYRNHTNMTCASLERTEPGMRLVVERYVQRRPDARSSRLHRRASANVERALGNSYLLAGDYRRFARLQLRSARLAPVDTVRATTPVVVRLGRLATRKAGRVTVARFRRLRAPVP